MSLRADFTKSCMLVLQVDPPRKVPAHDTFVRFRMPRLGEAKLLAFSPKSSVAKTAGQSVAFVILDVARASWCSCV